MEKKDEFEGIPRNNPHFILCYSDKAEDWGWTKEYVEDVLELINKYPDSEDLKDADIQNDIGCMFDNGLFGQKNVVEAVKWFEKSAAQGNDLAKSNLADILRKGTNGYPVDLKRAFDIYKSCGLPYAHYRVGEFYEKGWGTEVNMAEAKRYYRLAYQEGHPLAKKKLAEFNFME